MYINIENSYLLIYLTLIFSCSGLSLKKEWNTSLYEVSQGPGIGLSEVFSKILLNFFNGENEKGV